MLAVDAGGGCWLRLAGLGYSIEDGSMGRVSRATIAISHGLGEAETHAWPLDADWAGGMNVECVDCSKVRCVDTVEAKQMQMQMRCGYVEGGYADRRSDMLASCNHNVATALSRFH